MELSALAEAIIDGMADTASRLTRSALASGTPPAEVLEQGLLAGMRVVGVRFRDAQMFLPDVLASARAMKAAMDHLEPLLAAANVAPAGTVVIGTVKGDIHDIGKNLVGIMLRGAGYRVVDVGTGATAAVFVEAIRQHRPQIVGMSALLTTTMPQMKQNIEAFRTAGVLDGVAVLVGGAAVTRQYAESIGAAYAKDATEAVARAAEIVAAAGTRA
jgi:5-methyltetrahydrofolate--homocysteine methyltransferase